ncbi:MULTISPECIES: hypothetical protein [Priestia]|uniref:hypothetical protein n=1 Tax=Priestia TaxID=2800373 RepID=UPI00070A7FF7|nr:MULTISPECIES: hypothetical protein [Priestia]KRE01916.1 hypothetical protein ASE46_11595 [Bacillus sp. Root239]MBE5101903.1 hypothetical protein [Priestia aryabhattai]MCM3543791.1 hypothetical protein [Priestia megaterium]MEC1069010.1 hypothetical protein [Priestia megaterium]
MKINLRSPQIVFDDLTVNAVKNNAGVFIGKNVQQNWETTITRSNSGFGTISGDDNQLSYNTHLVLGEDDVNDSFEQVAKKA